jgi:nucleoside-diphosphate-sugar epimerase
LSKRVLVTGGTGFVGQHVVPNMVARGFQVTVTTRRSSDASLAGVNVITVGDLRSEIDWNRHLEGMDAVIHLAALAHITLDIPESDYDQINRRAAARLAKAASANGARFIFASSVAAQSGPSADRVLTEDDEPFPTTAYGRSKLRAEQEIKEASSEFVILRPTLIYGAGVIGNMRRLVRIAMSPVPPPFRFIRNLRSVLAVENMCDAIYFGLHSSAATNKTFLVADCQPISTSELVSQLRLGAGLNPTQLPIPPMLLRGMLQFLRRGDVWEKVAGNLVASVAKLEGIGFQWRIKSRDGLYALGELTSASSPRSRLERDSQDARALFKK